MVWVHFVVIFNILLRADSECASTHPQFYMSGAHKKEAYLLTLDVSFIVFSRHPRWHTSTNAIIPHHIYARATHMVDLGDLGLI